MTHPLRPFIEAPLKHEWCFSCVIKIPEKNPLDEMLTTPKMATVGMSNEQNIQLFSLLWSETHTGTQACARIPIPEGKKGAGDENRGEKRETRSRWNEGESRGRTEEETMKLGRECALNSLYLPAEELQEYHKTWHVKEPKWKDFIWVVLKSSYVQVSPSSGWRSQTHLFNGLGTTDALRWIAGQCSTKSDSARRCANTQHCLALQMCRSRAWPGDSR